ncbi:MAG: RimK/LysX family protein [Bythopirellula sp.]|nr:RimK/LysX family protein [Bythopirellula sp.]
MERPHCLLTALFNSRRLLGRSAFVGLCAFGSFASAQEEVAAVTPRLVEKRVIGPTTMVAEANSELDFRARVDTGAMTTSVHVEEWAIEDESEKMEDNLGKKIRFRMKNHKGESQWLESRIEEIGIVKTSEQKEERYKVQLTICWKDVKKQVLVTLNDRSHMKYPMLLGRNFLEGDFVVDVDLYKKPKPEVVPIEEASTAGDK